jgi:hypothetical protein
MGTDDAGTGIAISTLLFPPLFLLDLVVSRDYSIGDWAASALVLPYLIYFVFAILAWKNYSKLGKGLAVGGAFFSTIIVVGVLFLALQFSIATEG